MVQDWDGENYVEILEISPNIGRTFASEKERNGINAKHPENQQQSKKQTNKKKGVTI